jgi:hypothetical protein
MSGVTMGFSPPPWCGRVTVGPLLAGTYQVDYYLVRDAGPATLQGTLAFTVADAIPTLSGRGVILLVIILAAIGTAIVARRSST